MDYLKEIQNWVNTISSYQANKKEYKIKNIGDYQFVDNENDNIDNINVIAEELGVDKIEIPTYKNNVDVYGDSNIEKNVENPIFLDKIISIDDCSDIEDTEPFTNNELIDASCPSPLDEHKNNIVKDSDGNIASKKIEDISLGNIDDSIIQDMFKVDDKLNVTEQDLQQLMDVIAEDFRLHNKQNSNPDCVQKILDISKEIQSKTENYKNLKIKNSENFVEFFHKDIEYNFYNSIKIGKNDFNSKKTYKDEYVNLSTALSFLDSQLKNVTDNIKIEYQISDAITSILFTPYFKVSYDKKDKIKGLLQIATDELKKDIDSINKDENFSKNIDVKVSKYKNKISTYKKICMDASYSVGYYIGYNYEKFKNYEKSLTNENFVSLEKRVILLKNNNDEEKKLDDEFKNLNDTVNKQLSGLPCFSSIQEDDSVDKNLQAGGNPDFKDITKGPTYFTIKWWRKFCSLASIVNLFPTHWPVGILIPTPAGLIKVPCPIIWIPIVVIPTPNSITVFIIGQCGLLPSPFLFLHHFFPFPIGPFTPGGLYFPVCMRPSETIKGHMNLCTMLPMPPLPSLAMILMKMFNNLLEKYTSQLLNIRNQVKNIELNTKNLTENSKINGNITIPTPNIPIPNVDITINIPKPNTPSYPSSPISSVLSNLNGKTPSVDIPKMQINNPTYSELKDRIISIQSNINFAKNTLKKIIELQNSPLKPKFPVGELMGNFMSSLGSAKVLDASQKIKQFGFINDINPELTKSLPLIADDLPVWERLTLKNIPFLVSLWRWCSAGKRGGGFFENPF